MEQFSKNKKLNTVLTAIKNDIFQIYGNDEKLVFSELKRYKNNFPREIDYNFAQYGNLLVYYSSIRDFYRDAGYKSLERFSNEKIWEIYKRQVGHIIGAILRSGRG